MIIDKSLFGNWYSSIILEDMFLSTKTFVFIITNTHMHIADSLLISVQPAYIVWLFILAAIESL